MVESHVIELLVTCIMHVNYYHLIIFLASNDGIW